MEEVWSILQILSAVLSIIILLITVPSCLLICCCCRKHQGTIEKDLKDIARNHNLLQNEGEQSQLQQAPQRRLIKGQPRKRPTAQVKNVEPIDEDVLPNVDQIYDDDELAE